MWVLINLVPVLGSLYLFVHLGFMKGEPRDNRFGPDPLLRHSQSEAASAADARRQPTEDLPKPVGEKAPVFAWHVHHHELVEVLREPIEKRIEYIRKWMPKEEIAVRLALLKVVKGPLPAGLAEAWAAYEKADRWSVALKVAWGKPVLYIDANKVLAYADFLDGSRLRMSIREYAPPPSMAELRAAQAQAHRWEEAEDEASRAWNAARDALDKAKEAHWGEVLALHARECPNCPWNGPQSFPTANGVDRKG